MDEKEVKGSLAEMTKWMKESGISEDEIRKYSDSVGNGSRGMAHNCRRYVSGRCGETDMCLEYTIECCWKDDDGNERCEETTVCRC